RLATTLDETLGALTSHAHEMSEHLAAAARGAVAAFADHTGAVRENFNLTAQQAIASIGYQANDLNDRFAETANEAIDAIATQGDRVSEDIAGRLLVFEETVIGRGGAIASSIDEHADRFTATLADRL